ncbi:partial DNA primase TraC, partial [Methylococcales bacterium]
AHSETNEREKAAKLARIQEERVRRDPHSTPEDVSAAKEARKAAEAAAFVNEADLRHKRDEQERQADQVGQAGQAIQNPPERTYIDVPFSQKEEAKALGARWDRQEKSWYVPTSIDPLPFAKWERAEAATTEALPKAEDSIPTRQERQYLAVPYGERQAAKDHGALWDKAAKSWYVGPNADMEKLQRWKPENVPGDQGPALSPREEFAEALRSIGADVSGEHPIMDGQKHRIGVDGDKKGEQAGFYVGHLDGHPAGYMKNNRTGVEMRWKSKGYALDPEQKAKLQAEAAAKLETRAIEQERIQEQTAQRIGKQMEDLTPATTPTAYMQAKGIIPQTGAFTDREGQKTYIPATDADGKLWTMQYINEEGTKRFAKDSRKEGTFHVVGGLGALAQAPALVIGEGYATASSLSQSLGFAAVAAFDSGNLSHVAKALHEKFPDKPVIIAGDNDKHLELSQGINPGRIKAEEAAKAVGGKAIFPIFAPGENVYPAHLEPITPQSYRKHEQASKLLEAAEKEPDKQLTTQQTTELKRDLLSDEQLAAYNKIKAHTDFNDLATRSVLGKEGIERQVGAAVGKAQENVRQLMDNRQAQDKLELNKYRKLDKPEHLPRRSARIG